MPTDNPTFFPTYRTVDAVGVDLGAELRDVFAMHILPALLVGMGAFNPENDGFLTVRAYQLADAMLEVRKK